MAMFIRVKRKKTTYFLHCDPSETVLEIKQKLQALSDNPIDCQRLILLSSQLVLEDSKTLADQKDMSPSPSDRNMGKVENDAIVALCLKTSDPRVFRISTGLRPPPDPKLYELSEPPTSKKPPVEGEEEGVKLGEDGQPLAPPPTEPVPLERAMSTLLRTPYKPPPPTPDEIAKKEAAEKEAAKLEVARKAKEKEDLKKKALQDAIDAKAKKKGGKKDAGKKGDSKKDGKKGTVSKETGKKAGAAKGKKGKKGKKGDKDERNAKPEGEEILPPPDTGVWEDICIDRLTDYATLIDSD